MIFRALLLAALLGIGAGAGAAQDGLPRASILTISPERLFAESDFGKRVAAEIETAASELAAENRQIEAELTAEEKTLTEKRPETTPSDFRDLADAFDQKVQQIRREQDAKARDLTRSRDEAQAEFLIAIRPVLEEVMRDAGANVILERSSVFLSTNATDVTDLAVQRIDAVIGDGTAPAE